MDDVERPGTDSLERFGAAVQTHRQALELSVDQYAALAAIGTSTLRNIEAGTERPQETTLYKLDKAAGAPARTSIRILAGELAGYPPPPTPEQLGLAGRIGELDDRDRFLLQALLERLGA